MASAKKANVFAQDAALYSGKLHRYLVRRMRAGQDAEDLAQEVFLRLLRLRTAQGIREPMAYVYSVASQVVSEDWIRFTKRPISVDSDELDRLVTQSGMSGPDQMLDHEHARREVRRFVSKLRAAQRAVFLMKANEGRSVKEIAALMNLSVHQIKRYLIAAKKKFDEMRKTKAP